MKICLKFKIILLSKLSRVIWTNKWYERTWILTIDNNENEDSLLPNTIIY